MLVAGGGQGCHPWGVLYKTGHLANRKLAAPPAKGGEVSVFSFVPRDQQVKESREVENKMSHVSFRDPAGLPQGASGLQMWDQPYSLGPLMWPCSWGTMHGPPNMGRKWMDCVAAQKLQTMDPAFGAGDLETEEERMTYPQGQPQAQS